MEEPKDFELIREDPNYWYYRTPKHAGFIRKRWLKYNDKIDHFLLFFLLGTWGFYICGWIFSWWVAIPILFALSFFDETVNQRRTTDWWDLTAGMLGVAVGVVLWLLMIK
jgi:hypothetical protein